MAAYRDCQRLRGVRTKPPQAEGLICRVQMQHVVLNIPLDVVDAKKLRSTHDRAVVIGRVGVNF
jgi:hypothetical protein